MSPDPLPLRASFNPLIKPFLVMKIGLTLTFTVIGIPLAIVWFLGVGRWWAQHYFDRLECQLGERNLRFRKGILRHFNLSTLKFETAGHSVGQASDMHLTGIIDAQAFRAQIMRAREALRHPQPQQQQDSDEQLVLLRSIESKLGEIADLLRAR
jgi:hypothetical protein